MESDLVYFRLVLLTEVISTFESVDSILRYQSYSVYQNEFLQGLDPME